MSKLCAYPWVHLSNVTNGMVQPCCQYTGFVNKDNGQPFYLQKDSVEDIYTSTYFKNLRQEFREGKKPKGCINCWNNEEDGIVSKRQMYTNRLEQIGVEVDYNSEPSYPKEYQLVLNNSCNLKCRMCNPEYSSSWMKEVNSYTADELSKVGKSTLNLPNGQVSSKNSIFLKDIEKWSPYLVALEALGGEPLYSNAWYKLIDYLIENNYSKNITLSIVTNGTIFDKKFIKKLLTNFKYVSIALSIDGMDKMFEYLRSNGNWEEVSKNIEGYQDLLLDKEIKNFNLHFTYSVTWFNAIQIGDFLEYIKSKTPEASVWLNVVRGPKSLTLESAPNKLKPFIEESLINVSNTYRHHKADALGLINFMYGNTRSNETLQEFKVVNTILDKYRDVNIQEVLEYISSTKNIDVTQMYKESYG